MFLLCKLNALLLADDLVLIAENPKTLVTLLQALTQWCPDNGMSINDDETKIVHFRYPKKERNLQISFLVEKMILIILIHINT